MVMEVNKISIIGAFDFKTLDHGGQPVKTRQVYYELCKTIGKDNIRIVEMFKTKRSKVLFECINAMLHCKEIIMLPAHNGLLVLTPLLSVLNKFSNKKLHYVVIGGWLPEYLDKHQRVADMLRKNFFKIYVETNGMKKKLIERNFDNVEVMPNFKNLNINEDLSFSKEKPYRFCTFSRVMYEKGIEDAVNTIKKINEEAKETRCTLDIYGQIDSGYEQKFEELQKEFPEYIKYCGCVDAQKSGEVLKSYYALLFPTFYSGEGFAGTVIDAFAAGIPVIASDWRYNAEIVENMKSGIVYPHKNVEELKKSILTLINDTSLVEKMKAYCVQEAKRYLPETVISILLENIAE